MSEFTHIDENGRVRMVDVTDKNQTSRKAVARGTVTMDQETCEMILNKSVKKGNVLETARIAGIMAAKNTSSIIPMCHPLNLTHISVDFFPHIGEGLINIEASARTVGQTGVEMEALMAVSAAALTIYDMCKSYYKKMIISDICLVEKSGGKSGLFVREDHLNRRF